MPTIEYDLNYLQVGLLDLEGYLLSNELYWPVNAASPHGEAPYPRVTLGNLLLSAARAGGHKLPAAQETELQRLAQRLEKTRTEWRVAWEKKAQREFSARLSLWRDFVEDYRKTPEANVDRYRYEVSRRVLLDLLEPEAADIPSEERELLKGLDSLLRSVFVPGNFVWDSDLVDVFPKEKYWYLYGLPKSERS